MKGQRLHWTERSMVMEIGYSYMMQLDYFSSYTKINSKYIKNVSVKHETIKLLGGIWGQTYRNQSREIFMDNT